MDATDAIHEALNIAEQLFKEGRDEEAQAVLARALEAIEEEPRGAVLRAMKLAEGDPDWWKYGKELPT